MLQDEDSRFIRHTSCEACGSSDGNALYSNNTTYCFSCEKWDRMGDEPIEQQEWFEELPTADITSYPIRGFKDRGIPKNVSEHFGVHVGYSEDGEIAQHYYPYTRDGKVVAWKERTVEGKKFRALGDMKDTELFGQNVSGNRGILVITEGELDAMAVAAANIKCSGKPWNVVSIPSATGTRALINNLEWIKGFQKVVLAFDNDEPGQSAMQKAAKIIGSERAQLANFGQYKDANEVLLAEGDRALDNIMRNTKAYVPAGIVNALDTWDEYQKEKSAVYTNWSDFLPLMNEKIFGRRLGSITMFTSGTGCGKTQFCREDIVHIIKNTDEMVGIVSLEESVSETVRGLISIELNKRVGLPGVEVSVDDERKAFQDLFGSEQVMLLDHQGSVSDDSLMDKMNHLALMGCKYIYLDHITIAISEANDVLKGADQLMSDLLKLSKQHNVWVGVVSHLRKVGGGATAFEEGGQISLDDLRGSGSLKQISAQVIALSRNQQAEREQDRHTVKVFVLKDRWSGNTGYAGAFSFDNDTGRLNYQEASESDDTQGFDVV